MPVITILVCAILFLVGRGLAWCVNELFRRRVLNTAAVGVVCTLPWSLAPLYVLLTDGSGRLLRMSPEQQGGLVAMFVVPSVLVIAAGVWLAFHECARKFTTNR